MIPWLGDEPAFPPLDEALDEPNGLLAAGGALGPDWLLAAYRRGIFPWFGAEDPILWWSPDPRMVLVPAELKISRSLRRRLRHQDYRVCLDRDFAGVMRACAAPRAPGGGTWITRSIQFAYSRLHELGYAHSVECYAGEQLVGGLYGVGIGRMFYGESMFARATDASKVALAHLCRFLEMQGVALIDCQMTTDHLASLGGRELSRDAFARLLAQLANAGDSPGRWPQDATRDYDWGKLTEC